MDMMLDTERMCLSALLRGGWNFGGHVLSEDDFLAPEHREIFNAVKEIETSGQEADVFSVQARVDFPIDDIDQLHVGAKRCEFLANELKDASLRRAVLRVCHEVRSGEGKGRELLLEAQTSLASLDGKAGVDATLLADHVGAWWEEVGKRSEGGTYLKTGFPDVDKRLGGLRPGNLFILAGRPAMGKTALAMNIAKQCGGKVGFFSLEMSPEELLDRMAATESGVDLGTILSGKLSDSEWPRMTEAVKAVSKLPIYLDTTASLTIEEIHSRARSIKAKHGLDLVVVDYLQLIRGEQKSGYENVTHISKASKRMAKDLGVPVLMLSQLSRKVEERGNKRPLLSDLRESGSIEQDADVVAMVYRDEVYDENSGQQGMAELIFRKVRQGVTGSDWFQFDGAHQSFKQTFAPKVQLTYQGGPGY
jgi:replicative DNA helicase